MYIHFLVLFSAFDQVALNCLHAQTQYNIRATFTFQESRVIRFSGANTGGWYETIRSARTVSASSSTSSVRSLVSNTQPMGFRTAGSTSRPTLSQDSANDSGAISFSVDNTSDSSGMFARVSLVPEHRPRLCDIHGISLATRRDSVEKSLISLLRTRDVVFVFARETSARG